MRLARSLMALLLVSALVMPSFAQNRQLTPAQKKRLQQQRAAAQRAAAQRAAAQKGKGKGTSKPKPPPKPKSNLPSFEGARRRINVAPVDPNTRIQAKAHAREIDRLILANLHAEGIEPNAESNDAQFIRRAYLDIIGRIPTADETLYFLRATDSTKRERMIDRLLNSPGYASHSYNYWADILRIVDRVNNNTYIRPYGDWVKESLRRNTPYDVWVREMLTATGKPWDNPAVGYTLRDQGMPLDHLNNTVRVFLGTRIGCAQCHDHPFDRWTQKEFYQLAAFTSGTVDRSTNRPPKGMTNVPTTTKVPFRDIPNNSKEGRAARRVVQMNRSAVWENPYRNLKYPHDYAYGDANPNEVVKPSVIFGSMPPIPPKGSRRDAFAKWLTSKENPRFALTIANRLWKRNLGVGLIEPVDDMMDESKASNPKLMAYLENLMKELDFDVKEFQRIIYLTEAYQRRATMTAIDPEKPYHFQGPVLRRMTAEQVWDSLMTLTVPQPDTIVRQGYESYVDVVKVDTSTTKDQLLQKGKKLDEVQAQLRKDRNNRMYRDTKNIGGAGIELARASELSQPLPGNHFLRQFGQSDRQIIADGSTDGTVPQLLTMFNGPVTHMMLDGGSVMYATVASQKNVDDAIDSIFLSILNRRPTRTEKGIAEKEIKARGGAGIGDVIWALLNTREFLFVQ